MGTFELYEHGGDMAIGHGGSMAIWTRSDYTGRMEACLSGYRLSDFNFY